MKIEDQVCSREQSLKLLELGVNLKSIFYWGKSTKTGEMRLLSLINNGSFGFSEDLSPAPTVAELGVLLPGLIEDEQGNVYELYCALASMNKDRYTIWAQHYKVPPLFLLEAETEAHVRADALIWLIENEYIDPNELKL